VTARRKAERAVVAMVAGQWVTAADMFDEARRAASADPSSAVAALALDVMYALTFAFTLASGPNEPLLSSAVVDCS
jgi:hypothetical protein